MQGSDSSANLPHTPPFSKIKWSNRNQETFPAAGGPCFCKTIGIQRRGRVAVTLGEAERLHSVWVWGGQPFPIWMGGEVKSANACVLGGSFSPPKQPTLLLQCSDITRWMLEAGIRRGAAKGTKEELSQLWLSTESRSPRSEGRQEQLPQSASSPAASSWRLIRAEELR